MTVLKMNSNQFALELIIDLISIMRNKIFVYVYEIVYDRLIILLN